MSLAELLWKIEFSEEEKARVSRELADETSIQYKVFSENHKRHALFDSICRRMTRTITGFRPTAPHYRDLVSAEVLKKLRQNQAKNDYWSLYQNSVVDFFVSNLPALNQLLADTDVDEDFPIETATILDEIVSRSANYSVHDRDVEALYELWPFPRSPDFQEFLARCPKYDRFRAIDESIRSVEAGLRGEISDLRVKTAEDASTLVDKLKSKLASKADLKDTIETLRREAKDSAKSSRETIKAIEESTARLEKLVRRSETRRTQERNKFTEETERHLDELNAKIAEIKEESAALADLLERRSLTKTPSVNSPAGIDGVGSPFRLLTKMEVDQDASSIGVQEARDKFREIADEHGNSDPENQDAFFFSALMANCLVLIDKAEFFVWQRLVGWDRNASTVCASPLWVDDRSIAEELHWLLSQPDEPRCLTILDFELGYVEGYLAPFLKAWQQSGTFMPWKKILLVPSSSTWAIARNTAREISVLPGVIPNAADVGEAAQAESMYLDPENVRGYLHEISFQLDRDRAFVPGTATNTLGDSSLDSAGASQIHTLSRLPLSDDLVERIASETKAFWAQKCT